MRKVVFGCMAALAMMAGCTSIDCSVNSTVLCSYRFMNANGDSLILSNPISVVSARTIDGNDTVLINKLENACTFRIPMSYSLDADELRFIVTDNQGKENTDYVVVSKTNEPVFESVDCAPRYNHTISSVNTTHNFIDSLVVKNNKVTNDPTKINIFVYLHTAD